MSGQGGEICVTGASGYLGGRVLLRLRDSGVEARACPSRGEGLDLTDRAAVDSYFSENGFRTVIHCAAAVPKSAADYADESAGADSLAMTENLVAAGIPHIVFASSMTVYPADAAMPVREDDASDDGRGYAGFKRRAERALLASAGTVTILRLPGLFGAPRKDGLLFNAAARLAAGEDPSLPRPAPLWAALHVDDAADLLVRAATAPARGQIVLNAGYDAAMSVSATVSQLAARFGVSLPAGGAPLFRMDLGRLRETLGMPSVTLEERLAELASEAKAAREPACA